jgi:hypothetical protein
MNRYIKQFSVSSFATASGFLLAVIVVVIAQLLASTANFALPERRVGCHARGSEFIVAKSSENRSLS